ncbi:MAG TPA: hypothetical protein VK171_04850 [Fimbriimonas sp.]|nr:hypothetical protein [Fimbriimonas sp.]
MSVEAPEANCHNCRRTIPFGALYCGQCGSKRPPPNNRAESSSLLYVGLIFIIFGIPAGGFGACMGVMAVSAFPRYPAATAGFLIAALACLGVFGWSVFNMLDTANKK